MKTFNKKLNKMEVAFNKYEVDEDIASCPECKRVFKEINKKYLLENGQINCPKCGSKIIIKKGD